MTGSVGPRRFGTVLRTSSANAILRGATLASKFVLLFFLVRWTPTREVGLYALLSATVLFAIQLVGLEFHVFGERELLRRPREDWQPLLRDQARLHAVTWAVAIPLALGLFALGLMPWRYAGWFCVILLLEHPAQELYRILVIAGAPVAASVAMLLRNGAWCYAAVAAMALAPSLRNLDFVLACWTVGVLAGLTVSVVLLARRGIRISLGGPVDRAFLARGLRTAAPFLLVALALRAGSTVDRYILEHHLGLEAVGRYAFFFGMSQAVQATLETGVITVLYPQLLVEGGRGAGPRFRAQLAELARWVVGSAVLLAGLAAVLVAPVLALLHRPDFVAELPTFWWLLAAVVVVATSWVPHQGLYALGGDRALVSSALLTLAATVGLDLALIPRLGSKGAAIALLVGSAVGGVFKLWVLRLRLAESGVEATG